MDVQRSFFWNGILSLNSGGDHAFFDIKIRKNTQETPPQVSLYTSDVPPLPVKKEDVLKATFLLENNVGANTVRYKIAEATFLGSVLEKQTANLNQNFVSITTDTAEWHFMKQTNWVLYFISVKVPAEQLKKFMPLG